MHQCLALSQKALAVRRSGQTLGLVESTRTTVELHAELSIRVGLCIALVMGCLTVKENYS